MTQSLHPPQARYYWVTDSEHFLHSILRHFQISQLFTFGDYLGPSVSYGRIYTRFYSPSFYNLTHNYWWKKRWYELYVKRWYYTRRENFMWIFTFLTPNNCLSPVDWASQVAQRVKNLPAMQEMLERWVWWLSWARQPTPGLLPVDSGPGGLPPTGRKELDTTGQRSAGRLNLGRESIFRLFYGFIVSETCF